MSTKLTYKKALGYYNQGTAEANSVLDETVLAGENGAILKENTKDKSKLFTDCMTNGVFDAEKAYDKTVRLMSLAVLRDRISDDRAMSRVLDYTFWITLNANDFFGFATAMGVNIDVLDLDWIMDVVKKHPKAGMNAVMAFVMEMDPIKPHQTPEFHAAMEYIKSLTIETIWSRDQN